MYKFILMAVFVLANIGSDAFAERNPIKVFREVAPGIYRGARPEKAGVQYLKKMGFKTILNIENNVYEVAKELREADRLGLRVLTYPVDSWYWPETRNINNILRELTNPENHPIFLHCQHGQDRTGLVTALFRVEYQGWTPERAYREARNLGFHRSLIALYEYYKARTGFRAWWDEVDLAEQEL